MALSLSLVICRTDLSDQRRREHQRRLQVGRTHKLADEGSEFIGFRFFGLLYFAMQSRPYILAVALYVVSLHYMAILKSAPLSPSLLLSA